MAIRRDQPAISPRCDKTRLAHGLPVLTPRDWLELFDAGEPPLPEVA